MKAAKALLGKELRGIAWAGLAVLVWCCLAATNIAYGLQARRIQPAPTQPPNLIGIEALQMALALGLGAWLSWSEEIGRSWLLLLTRPVSRATITGAKLLAGLVVLLPAALTPVAWLGWLLARSDQLGWPWDASLLIAPQRRAMLLVPWFLTAFLCGLPHRAHPVGRWLPLGAMVLCQRWVVALPWTQAQVAGVVALVSLVLLLAVVTARVEVDTA